LGSECGINAIDEPNHDVSCFSKSLVSIEITSFSERVLQVKYRDINLKEVKQAVKRKMFVV
jgi:hypothetical protein